jgi:hypothetical protein
MRNYTKQRGPREDCPQSREVQEREGRVRISPLQQRRKSLYKRGQPGAGQSRTGRPRGKALLDRGKLLKIRGSKPYETKSLLEHLIKSIEERSSGLLAHGE